MINKKTLLLTVLMIFNSLSVHAQFDDFGGGDNFTPPPPPPGDFGGSVPPPGDFSPPSASAGGNSGSRVGGLSALDNKDGGVLSGRQKQRLSQAAIEDITNENFPETIESFDFPNADIQDIVKAISELTGKNFIIDQGVRGKITIIAPSKISVAEAYKAFLSALAINGYAVVPSGKFLKIRSARNAQRDSIETYSGSYFPNSDTMITRIIHLKHISADLVNRDLRILTSKDGEMSIYAPTNSLIISDYGANIERVMKIINQLDIPGFEDQLEVIPVRYAKAKDIAELIDKIVNKGDKNNAGRAGGGFTAGVPRFSRTTTQGSQGSAYFMVIPDDRTNSLIVSGNKTGIERIRKLLKQLDFRIRPEDQGGVNVYYVKYGEAEKIAQTLQGIAKDASPKAGTGAAGGVAISPTQGVVQTQEIFGGEVKITADKGTNSLVIVASKQDYEVVLNLLSKIDIPRDQVFVEAVIMEMKVTDNADYNIGYFQYADKGGGAKAGFNGLQSSGANSLQNILTPAGGAGAILGFASGGEVDITPAGGGTPVKVKSLLGFLTFLKKNAQANILSTPQILAMDNQEATIEVGDKVVTGGTTTTTATGSQTTPIFEDATIKLKIKPFISPASNSIRLELDQTVQQLSQANTPKGFQDTAQALAKRNIKTNIVVNNGDTAVLGGLMKEDEQEDITKVPLLGDIPIVGWLFKSRSISKQKINMTIFLTPKILRTVDDSRALLSKKMDQRLKFIKGIGGRDPFGETADELQKKSAGVESPGVSK